MRCVSVAAAAVAASLLAVSSAAAQGHAGHAQHQVRVCPDPRLQASRDSGFAAMQKRGQAAMGVDQYTTRHQFEALNDGGRIIYESPANDAAEVAQIRKHLSEIARAFAAGDFSTPGLVHAETVPGTLVMAARRDEIEYIIADRPRGAELRMRAKEALVLHAIYEFMAYQSAEHLTC